MPRTEAEKAASDKLAEAIEEMQRVYFGESNGQIGDYIVVYEEQRLSEDDDITYSMGYFLRDGRISSTRAVGLLETASFEIKMGDR